MACNTTEPTSNAEIDPSSANDIPTAASSARRSSLQQQDLAAAFALQPHERQLRIDGGASKLLFYTYRGGRLARFGHNHVIAARSVVGVVDLTEAVVGTRFALQVLVSGLSVDEAPLRAAAGADFDSKPSPEDIAATRANMLSATGLAAQQYPQVLVTGVVVEGGAERAEIDVKLSIRGISQTVRSPVTFTRRDGQLIITGQLEIKQSDYGMTPFSVMLGALTVLDAVRVEFDLLAR